MLKNEAWRAKLLAFWHHPYWQTAALLALGMGAWMRVSVWLEARSVFLDEANLIRNWIEKDYTELWGNLDYEQYAPPLFSSLSKLIISVGGINEWTVRLLPLICGLFSLFLFFKIGKTLLSPFALCWASGFFAWGLIFIQYATEAKQYSSDVFVALLLVFFAERHGNRPFSWKKCLFWAIFGTFVIWFSMPSVFVLAGVGCYFLWKNRTATKAIALLSASGILWIINFCCYFFFVLKTEAESTYLQEYHNEYFLAFPPGSWAELSLLGNQLIGILSTPFHYTFLPLSAAVVCFLYGIFQWFKSDVPRLLLLVIPILLTLLASVFGYYSIMGRLLLFFLPFLLFITLAGLDAFFKKVDGNMALLLAVFLGVGLVNRFEISALKGKVTLSEPDLIAGIQHAVLNQAPDDAFFAYYGVAPTVRYYTQHRTHPYDLQGLVLQNYRCCGNEVILDDLAAVRKTHERIWVLWDTPDTNFLKTWTEKQGGSLEEKAKFHRGALFLLKFD